MKCFTLLLTVAIAHFSLTGLSGQCLGSLTVPIAGSSTGGSTGTTITTHPSNQTTSVGSSFTLTAAATGANLTYQWKKDGVNISLNGSSASYTKTGASLSDGGIYQVVVHGDCGPDQTSNDVTVTITSALPLEWLDFQAVAGTDPGIKNVSLTWITASERDVQHFVVERSKDGKNFEKIGIPVAGKNTATKNTYQVIDPTPLWDISYYRIKEVSLSGKMSFSIIRSVLFNGFKVTFRISPNPKAEGIPLQIETNWNENFIFTLYDLSGKRVYTRPCKGSARLEDINLSSGFYLYECATPQDKVTGKLFVPN